ncbi:MAG: hypothetical protein QOJ54_1421 [Aliidongia sp.]|jgi:predicted transcriptional regulator|nr:hypothetical protein [Aliidongia sp.]
MMAVPLISAGAKPRGRQAIWLAARQIRRFTVRQLASDVDQDRGTVFMYVRALEAAGFLAKCGTEKARQNKDAAVYELIKDTGFEAPKILQDGTPSTYGKSNEQMWRTMKMLVEFSTRELSVAASTEDHLVEHSHAKNYVKWLHRAGYLKLVLKGTRKQDGRYRFIQSRNSGPMAPMLIRMNTVYDRNVDQIVWHEEPAE